MTNLLKRYIAVGFILTAFAVLFGAFGAHALKDQLTPHYLGVFETANKYHFIHSVGMVLALFLIEKIGTIRNIRLAFFFFLMGIILFSGSLYLLSIADLIDTPGLKIMGAITPIGGLFFVLAWSYSAYIFLKNAAS